MSQSKESEHQEWAENVRHTAEMIAAMRDRRAALVEELSAVDGQLGGWLRRFNDLGETLNEWAARDVGALR